VLTDSKGQVPRLWSCPTATATKSYIRDTRVRWKTALASQSGSTTGLQGMEGTSLGGELVLVSACLTVTPLITGGQEHTHTLNTFKRTGYSFLHIPNLPPSSPPCLGCGIVILLRSSISWHCIILVILP
jgi:hypothetical protein